MFNHQCSIINVHVRENKSMIAINYVELKIEILYISCFAAIFF